MTEVQRPNSVLDFFQADLVLLQGVGEKEQPLLEADRASVGDPLDDEMAGYSIGGRLPVYARGDSR